jgi:alpha-glucosidase/alpha-D-xyloside xylohydrolase
MIQTAAGAGVSALTPLSVNAQESAIQIAGKPVEVTITSISPQTVRITALAIENGQIKPLTPDGALAKDDFGKPAARLRSVTGTQTIKAGDLTVKVTGSPLTLRIESRAGLVQELKCDAASGEIFFLTGDKPVFGLGQGGPQFDRRGNVDRMVSGQGGYRLATHGAKVPIPFLVGTAGWAIFAHLPVAEMDLKEKDGAIRPKNLAAALPLDLFITASQEPRVIMGEYAKITGYPELAPLWAFGYQQSHRTLGPPEEILEEAKKFREKKMPCETMIYLGTEFCPNGWNTRNGEFTWNEKAFPDPKAAIGQLHEDHFKVVLHIVVEGRHFYGKVSDPCTAEPLPPGRTPDNRWPPDRQVSCYWPAHKPLMDLGIDGWWPDQGDGYDAPSRLARNRMYFEGTQMYRPNERVYALHRNASPGMQRIAAFLWSGDIQSTWETLKTHVPVAINTGLSGIPYWGTDIGGFVPTQEYTGELYARWFQFAAFNTLFRSHGRDWRLHLPWGWTVGEIGYPETPSYKPSEEVLHNPAIEPICKKYLELRSQMMPYLYSAVKETCESGMPVIRALWLHYPDDAAAVMRSDEYLYGRDLLVAPVVEKGATTRLVYLPAGSWYDFWTHEKLQGGREISKQVDLATIPLFVRAGAILPMGPIRQYTSEPTTEPLAVWIHPGANGAFSLYEDDGHSFNFRKGEFQRIELTWNDAGRRLQIRLAPGSKMLEGKKKIVARVTGESASREITFEGKAVDVKL